MTIEARIRTDIETRIRSGAWLPGHRIPFEHELVEQYGCARATVSKALTSLARAGLIERRRKSGSFVALQKMQWAVLDVPDIAAIIAARGERYRFVLATRTVLQPEEGIPGEMDFDSETRRLWLKGTHFAGETAFAAEVRAISLATVPDAEHADFQDSAPGSWLLKHVPWTQARHRIGAVSAGLVWGAMLGVGPHEACLAVDRWTWRDGAAVTCVRQVSPGSRHSLTAEFSPTAGIQA